MAWVESGIFADAALQAHGLSDGRSTAKAWSDAGSRLHSRHHFSILECLRRCQQGRLEGNLVMLVLPVDLRTFIEAIRRWRNRVHWYGKGRHDGMLTNWLHWYFLGLYPILEGADCGECNQVVPRATAKAIEFRRHYGRTRRREWSALCHSTRISIR